MLCIKDGPGRILFHGQRGPGKNEIQLCHIPGVIPQLCEVLSRRCRQLCQHLFDFLLFLDEELPEGIIEFHDRCRLDEKGRACLGLIVHQARHLRLILCLYRQAVAIVPHGDHIVLEIGGAAAVYHLCQLGMNPFIGLQDAAAHLFEGRAGIICHFLLGENAPADLGRKLGQRRQAVKEIEKGILLLFCVLHTGLVISPVGPNSGHIFQKRGNVQQLRGRQGGADGQCLKGTAKIPVAAKGHAALSEQKAQGILCLLLHPLDLRQARKGHQLPAKRLARGGVRMLCQLLYDLLIFYDS